MKNPTLESDWRKLESHPRALHCRRRNCALDGGSPTRLQTNTRWLGWLALSLLGCLAWTPALGQSYSMDWHTVDGGGGTSTSGVYAVAGTIGQPDAGAVMTGGTFSLQGGFWALPLAVQSTNAPTLTIAPASPGFATISWEPSTPGFVLQSSPSLSPPQWTDAPSGSTNNVTVPATLPMTYYRLRKP